QAENGIPWASRSSWQAANQAIAYHLQRYRTDLKQLYDQAQALKSRLNAVFPILNALCTHSCPWCPDPCCLKANAWFDLKDLLFLHFNKLSIPPCQPKASSETPCRYFGSKGCRLPRITRPWICTWYLCPTQTAKLRKDHPAKHKLLDQAFAQIKSDRNLMESEYIRIAS
ncbi:MAG: hypothetical protein PVJ35_08135, partial [Desulfobacterales bacterium]